MQVWIYKGERMLYLRSEGRTLLACPVALGRCPLGHKQREGDGRTPEGVYRICLVKEAGKYGRSMGLSYPAVQDAHAALRDGRIDAATHAAILAAHAEGRRPPWGSPLGGEIYIHEGGAHRDWTQGCIALEAQHMDVLYAHWRDVEAVTICP